MNQRDQENLNFLLSVGEAGLREWYDQASEDDIEYAQELLSAYEMQLNFAEKGVVFAQQSKTLH